MLCQQLGILWLCVGFVLQHWCFLYWQWIVVPAACLSSYITYIPRPMQFIVHTLTKSHHMSLGYCHFTSQHNGIPHLSDVWLFSPDTEPTMTQDWRTPIHQSRMIQYMQTSSTKPSSYRMHAFINSYGIFDAMCSNLGLIFHRCPWDTAMSKLACGVTVLWKCIAVFKCKFHTFSILRKIRDWVL